VPLGLSGPLNPLADPGDAPPPGPVLNPLAATPKLGTAPTPADAYDANSQAYTGWLAQQRASGVASGMIDPNTGWPTQNALVDAAHQWGSAMIAGTGAPGEGFTAYHGSPHSFDQFKSFAIGTGEGAQAYGHGLYFAGKEDVAKSYKNAGPAANSQLDAINGRMSELSNIMNKDAIQGSYRQFRTPEGTNAAAEYDTLMEQRSNLGHMYEVNINADPAHFLDWDKPRDQQPQKVQDFISKNYPDVWEKAADGSSLYQHLARWASDNPKAFPNEQGYVQSPSVLATHILREGGIPGIRYLDGGSRADGQGSSNHVIFNADSIAILRKYGIAGLMAGGAAAATQGQPTQ
jgi:hypothetical protein